jgi:hypothetical protein
MVFLNNGTNAVANRRNVDANRTNVDANYNQSHRDCSSVEDEIYPPRTVILIFCIFYLCLLYKKAVFIFHYINR